MLIYDKEVCPCCYFCLLSGCITAFPRISSCVPVVPLSVRGLHKHKYELHTTVFPMNYMSIQDNNRQVSNIRRTLVGNKIVDHSDVVGASPVGAAPTTSSFST